MTINGTDVNISSVSVVGDTVLIDMGSPFAPGDILGFSYYDDTGIDDEGAIQNAAGEDAGTAVFNLVADTAPAGPSVTAIASTDGTVFVPASATDINYTVTFSEAVSGVDAADFELAATGTASGTITGVAPVAGGASYTVTIGALAGDGKLGLNLKASGTGIQNGGGTPIAAGFTGEAVTLDHTLPAAPAGLALDAGSDSGVPGDGIGNVATPTVSGNAEAGATITLYDTDGSTVLGSIAADGGGKWSITSTKLGEGAHTLTAIQTDTAGNTSTASSGLSYALDIQAPTAIGLSATTLTQAAATSGSTLATLSALDATAVSYLLATGDGTNDADNARFSIADNKLVAAQNLTAGDYRIYVGAVDAAGNTGNQVFTITVSDAPAVAGIVRAASAPATVPASATSIAYTVTFNQAVTGVDAGDFALTTKGSASGAVDTVTDSGDGATYTVTVDALGGDGELRLDLNASGTGIEGAGKVAIAGGYTGGASYQLDHTAPDAPALATLAPGGDTGSSSSDGITSVNAPTFTGTVEPNATVRLLDSDGKTVLGSVAADGAGLWSITSSILADGDHTLTVRQVDAAGNESPASPALTLTIDTTAAALAAPTLAAASDSGVAGDNLTNTTTPTVEGTAEAFADVTLYDTDGATVLGTATASASGAWSIAASKLATGSHSLSATQRDRAGNLSAAGALLALEIDITAPDALAAPVLAAASDSGTLGDNITNVGRPLLSGSAGADADVTLYDSDGATVLGTTKADGAGNWSIISSTLAVGVHTLSARQSDLAGNASAAGAALSLTIEAPPAPPPLTPPSGVIDGVEVMQEAVTLPGGGAGSRVTIPIVPPNRVESSGNAALADIPLAISNGANLLLAQLSAGVGLASTVGPVAPAGDPLQQLIQAIVGATPGYSSEEQGHLTGNGLTFLEQLSASVPLLVQTIVPASAASAPGATLTLTGTSTPEFHTALVIDTKGLAPEATLQLNAVDFAAIVGAANVAADAEGQILSGDQAAQRFAVSAESSSAVFAGGGNDTLAFDSVIAPPATPVGASAALIDLPGSAPGTSVLHGGLGADSAAFNGALDSYTVERHFGHVLVASKVQPQLAALVINAENLVFADTTVALDDGDAIEAIAGLYGTTLGRQADYLGIDFWSEATANRTTLGAVTLAIIESPESQAISAKVFTGDNANDLGLLYQAIFDRAADADGLAYWGAALDAGATLEQVAGQMMTSPEIAQHQIAAPGWDFQVG